MLSRAIPRSFISPIATVLKRSAMSSAVAVDDVQDWRRHISPKVPAYWVFTKPIQKSQQDDREYRLIRLDNGLQAMLVHDAKADKAAASLDVAVGHLHDPVSAPSLFPIMSIAHTWQVDMPGLAHFCEHLLFMVLNVPRRYVYNLTTNSNTGNRTIPKGE